MFTKINQFSKYYNDHIFCIEHSFRQKYYLFLYRARHLRMVTIIIRPITMKRRILLSEKIGYISVATARDWIV